MLHIDWLKIMYTNFKCNAENSMGGTKRSKDWNEKMHVDNKYAGNRPDFKKLAKEDVEFSKFVNNHGQIDWQDPRAKRELTRVLLERDFNLKWWIPVQYLCPALPNRLNYLYWIRDLISCIPNPPDIIRGIDIGTGASCIYSLLATRLFSNWTISATDIDPIALSHAKTNVRNNSDIQDRIDLIQVDPESILLPVVLQDSRSFVFCMCNPPFFDPMTDVRDTTERTVSETFTTGGEEEFIKRMIRDSLVLKDRVIWYSSMVGRKQTLAKLLSELRRHGIQNTRTATLYQGKTIRWVIAWSFTVYGFEFRGPEKKKPKKTSHVFPLDQLNIDCVTGRIQEFISTIKEVRWNHESQEIKAEGDWTGRLCIDENLELTFVAGKRRDLFWKFAEQLQAAVLQKNRKYKRIRL